MSDDEVFDEDVEEEENDDLDEPGDDDLSGDDTFLSDDDDDDDDDDSSVIDSSPPVRGRRRATLRQSTVAGVPRAKLEKADVAKEIWEQLREKGQDVETIDYSIRAQLPLGAAVNHKTFGLGFVVDLAGPTKADVLFEQGLKKLVHNR